MIEKEYIIDSAEDFDLEALETLIQRHRANIVRYEQLRNMYIGKHEILSDAYRVDTWKPNNKLVANFAKYIVDTFNGYFMGIPVVTYHDNEEANNYINLVEAYNDIDDNNAELSKYCDIFGHGYEIIFADEEAQIGIKAIDPREGFIVYDNSIRARALFGVRYRTTEEGSIEGTYSDDNKIYYFTNASGKMRIIDEKDHYFGQVPMVEYLENEERLGAFESVETLINAYNKAISEKANDVDYFADAYMKILGAELDEKSLEQIKRNRIINMFGADTDKLIVEFMEKPNADGTQENLINRLEKLIFSISMVANITDEKFGTSSGIALKYKLQSMSNLANTKERKFVKGFAQRYRIIANFPNAKITPDEAATLHYSFTRNAPTNLVEEADTALKLKNVISDETAIRTLSIVDNVKDELERIKEEDRFDNPYDRENHGVDLDEELEERIESN